MENKKAELKAELGLNSLVPIVLILVVLAIVLTFGQNILSSFKTGFTAGTYEYNSTLAGQQGLDTVAQKQNMIALIVVVAVIIGILVSVLYVKGKQ